LTARRVAGDREVLYGRPRSIGSLSAARKVLKGIRRGGAARGARGRPTSASSTRAKALPRAMPQPGRQWDLHWPGRRWEAKPFATGSATSCF